MDTLLSDVTANTLAGMLTENTECNIANPGGDFRQHWQRNQDTDFKTRPETQLKFWQYGKNSCIIPLLSVYHFLKSRLRFNPKLNRDYAEYVKENQELGFTLESSAKFVDHLTKAAERTTNDEPLTINTCNDDDLFSRIIQYICWSDADGPHVMLQIHRGRDAQSSYTVPVAFDTITDSETLIFHNTRAVIHCIDCDSSWTTDNDLRWYRDRAYSMDQPNLEDYPIVNQRPVYPGPSDSAQLTLPSMGRGANEGCAGVLWIDEEHNGHCPHCGGLLRIDPGLLPEASPATLATSAHPLSMGTRRFYRAKT